MHLSTQQISERWMNDQLDLYNYAIQIGDVAWQQQILERLQHKDNWIAAEVSAQTRLALWQRFDEINQKVLDIYDEMRNSSSLDLQRSLLEKAWALKVERILIGKKIKGSCKSVGE